MANKYIAFISYRHAELDSAIAKSLHSLIEQYRIPRGIRKAKDARLGVVFRDQEELHAASDLSSEIQNALNSTEYLIVICSKNSVESPWVTREVDHFLQNHDRSQVLTVLASGEPMEVFPPQLTRTPEGDLIEPLAVDIRADTIAASRKKLRKELPRLIAAMLRCPYDALVMREQKRKTRRITAIAAGAMAILLGFTSMVLVKNQQIALANNQLEEKNTQLNQANVILEEQKEAIQLRESQLLVQSAQADLDNADFYGAIQKAVDALPADKTDTRPYYAPAEQILMQAMGVFRTEIPDVELNTTEFSHLANVQNFILSTDGTRLISVDHFGTVTCFDVTTQQQLWYQYTTPEKSTTGLNNLHLFLSADNSTVIRSTKSQLTAYDLQTGDLRWEATDLSLVADYIYPNPQRDSLITVTSTSTPEFTYQYDLVEIDMQTGRILQQLYLDTTPSFTAFIFASPGYTEKTPVSGIFSQDGTVFVGTYLDSENYLHLLRADLAQGSLEILYTHPTPAAYLSETCGLQFTDPDHVAAAVYESTSEEDLFLINLDLKTGKPVWQTHLTSSVIPFASYSVTPHLLYLNNRLIVAYCDRFTLIDPQTGTILNERTVNGLITCMTQLNETNFAFSVDRGTYAIGWIKTDDTLMLTTDVTILVQADVAAHNRLQVWGGGIVQLYMDDQGFQLGIGNLLCPGYIALIPIQKKNVIQIIRPADAPLLNTYTEIQSPDRTLSVSSECVTVPMGNYLVMGPMYEQGVYGHEIFAVLDPATQQIVKILDMDGYYNLDELFWLPDSLTPVSSKQYYGLSLLQPDGSKTVLFDPDAAQEARAVEDGKRSSYRLFNCASAYLSGNDTLLSAAIDTKQLRLWFNGTSETTVALPDALTTTPKDSDRYNRLFTVGANGWVLTSLHPNEEPVALEHMALYDTHQKKWTTLQGTGTVPGINAIALAQKAATMVFIGADGTAQVLDLNTGKVLSRFDTRINAESVLRMQFFLDDSCLAIKTAGGYLHLYRLATGEQLYYTQLQDAYMEYLQIFEDHRNQRIYIHGGSNSGLCLDVNSWSSLGQIDDLLYYHASQDLLYQANGHYEAAPIAYAKIPDTMQLVTIAREALANRQ